MTLLPALGDAWGGPQRALGKDTFESTLLPLQTHLSLLRLDAAGRGEADDLVLEVLREVADPLQVVQGGQEQDVLWGLGILRQDAPFYQFHHL